MTMVVMTYAKVILKNSTGSGISKIIRNVIEGEEQWKGKNQNNATVYEGLSKYQCNCWISGLYTAGSGPSSLFNPVGFCPDMSRL